MRQFVVPAALGSCCAPGVMAAEWSITPSYTASVDYDSNRRLLSDGKASDAAVLDIDVLFKRALEDLQLTFEPRYIFRRFTDPQLGNGDDRSAKLGANWLGERSTFSWMTSYWDQSTLTTELLETGIVSADTHRRTFQSQASASWNQTERRSLIAQLSYTDVAYYGANAKFFPGYRYPSGTLGERFLFNERGSISVSAFGSLLKSGTEGDSSRELGAQAEINYSFSERTSIDASVGRSTRKLGGETGSGTDASVNIRYALYRGELTAGYVRSLVPYGIGFLVEQQRYTAAYSRPLTPYLSTDASFIRVQNNETAVLLRVDRPNYNSLSWGLTWRPLETWSFGARVAAVRAGLVGPGSPHVNGWNSVVSVTWYPFPKSRSW